MFPFAKKLALYPHNLQFELDHQKMSVAGWTPSSPKSERNTTASASESRPIRTQKGDIVIVAHGHILRAFAMRWIGKPLTETALILEAGGVGTLRYAFQYALNSFKVPNSADNIQLRTPQH